MKVIQKAAVVALAAALLPNGVDAAKLYKCVSESGATTYKQTPCADTKQQKVLKHNTQASRSPEGNTKGKDSPEAKAPENQQDQEAYKASIRKRLDVYGAEALRRMKSTPEEAIEGGYAVAGMTKSQVRTAMGEPTSMMDPDYSMGPVSETWIYETPSMTEFVFFRGGKVTSMSGNLY
jgi:hypothetical protein